MGSRRTSSGGYLTVFVDIPEQSVDQGIVKLKVTEGTVGKLRVVGSHYYSQKRILEKVPELAEGNVPYFPEVQKELGDINKPGKRVTPVLRAGRAPGTVEAELKVEDQLPFHASLELNNYYSPNTTHLRLAGMVRYDNLWQREHSLSLQYQTSPQDTSQVKVLSANYVMPVHDGKQQLAFYAVHSDSNVAAVDSYTVIGKGDIFGARWIMPLPSRGTYFHSATLGVDFKHFKEDLTTVGADNAVSTPMTYMPFVASYSGTLSSLDSLTQFDASLNFNIRGLGDRMVDCYGQNISEFECKRYQAKASYFYLRGGVQRTQKLPWGLSLYGKLDGQMTSQPLISNEQFAAGGEESVRGYLESEQVGDDGIHGRLELRSPSIASHISDKVNDLHFLAFMDGAKLRIRQALPGQQPLFYLSSAGLGLHLQSWRYLDLSLDIGWPFKDTSYTQSGKARTNFRMAYEF